MTRLEITDIFFIPKKGIVVTGDIDDTFKDEFTMGERVKIVRPDGTYVISAVQGTEKVFTVSGQKKIGVLLDAIIAKEDVPCGSVMTIIDSQ
jgi:translation elongation factor EF-Tu-like GTPase